MLLISIIKYINGPFQSFCETFQGKGFSNDNKGDLSDMGRARFSKKAHIKSLKLFLTKNFIFL